MNVYHRGGAPTVNQISDYPAWGILAAVAVLLVTPMVSRSLVFIPLAICAYRIVRYDARVFSVDLAVLTPLVTLFQFNGMALMVYVCLLAAIWYFIRGGIEAKAYYVLLIVLMNYLLLRMQMQITSFVLCFGQMFLACVILPKQDTSSAVRTAKAFCASMTLSSIYALVFRDASFMTTLRGHEAAAYFGSEIFRFQGLFEDPNYYMTLLCVGIALLLKLLDSKKIRLLPFLTMLGVLVLCGVLTYSKTFFLMVVLMSACYIMWQFNDKKILKSLMLVLVVLLVANVLLVAEDSIFSVVLTRLTTATDISELPTGRSDVFAAYWNKITENIFTFLFGQGMGAKELFKAPHNLYLEIVYYTGVTGLLIPVGCLVCLFRAALRKVADQPKQSFFSKYLPLLTVVIIFFALHGMFTLVLYVVFYLVTLSIMIVKKEGED